PGLWHYANGAWNSAPAPHPDGVTGPATGGIFDIHMLSATVGWMFFPSEHGRPFSPMYRMAHGQWVQAPVQEVPLPFNGQYYSGGSFAYISSTEFWAMSPYNISHYHNGKWVIAAV